MSRSNKKLSKRQIVRALVRVARQTAKTAPLAVAMKVITAIIDAVVPLVTAYFAALTTTQLVDAYVNVPGASQRAIIYAIITGAISVANLLWTSIARLVDEYAQLKITNMASDQLLKKFAALDFWRYDDKKTADLYDQAESFTMNFSTIFNDIMSLFTNLVQLTIAIISLMYFEWWYGVILLASLLPSAIVQLRLSRAQTTYWRNNVGRRRSASSIRWNVFQPDRLAETRMYGLIGFLMNLYRELRSDDERARLSYERKFIWQRLGSNILEAIGELTVIVATIVSIAARRHPVGQFVYVQQLVSRSMGSVSSFISTIASIDERLTTLYDYEEFLSLPDSTRYSAKAPREPEMISLRHASFTYPSADREVLHNISLEIKRGHHLAIVGENGAGKSTLIKLLIGQYNPTKGSVYLDEQDMAEIDVSTWQSQVAVLTQDYTGYWYATAKENVYYGDVSRPFDEARYTRAVQQAEADGFIAKLPKQGDTIMNKWLEHEDGTKGADISGGQWQRLALARNFYRDVPYIVLDEPTSAIDALAESRIFGRLFASHDKTIITISHRLSTVKKADMICLMHEGKIIEQGTYEELMQQKGRFYTMFEAQL